MFQQVGYGKKCAYVNIPFKHIG